jgi:hypothetical protein
LTQNPTKNNIAGPVVGPDEFQLFKKKKKKFVKQIQDSLIQDLLILGLVDLGLVVSCDEREKETIFVPHVKTLQPI